MQRFSLRRRRLAVQIRDGLAARMRYPSRAHRLPIKHVLTVLLGVTFVHANWAIGKRLIERRISGGNLLRDAMR